MLLPNLMISSQVLSKLSTKHQISRDEVEQCFLNREGVSLEDTREGNVTTPPTQWFLARTNKRRLLKVVYVRSGLLIDLKTCYEPSNEEIRIYTKYGNGGQYV